MANHKSAEKAYRRSLVFKAKNTSIMSNVKTFIKKVKEAISLGDAEAASKSMSEAESKIWKSAAKGLIKKNTAARRVSRLTKKVNALSQNKQV